MVQQYWWINQTRMHSIERDKNVVAGEINVKNRNKTHWGRKNVNEIKKGAFIVCYRSGIGIDRLAYVMTSGEEDHIPWEDDDKRRAYVANVEYLSIKPITKKDFWDDLKDTASGNEEPIDLIRGQIRYAYAMKLPRNAFDKIIDLAECRNPGIVKKWLQGRAT
jgi:hypothetical protein